MHYLADPYRPKLKQHLRQLVLQWQEQARQQGTRLHVYALVDGAVDEAWGMQLMQQALTARHEVQALYEGTALQGAEESGLFLIRLAENQLGALLKQARARPMLAFLQSALSLDQLRGHLALFARAQTQAMDGYWFALRWGCPNRVPDLLAALGEGPRAMLLSGLAAWHLISRDGGLQTIEGCPPLVAGAAADLSQGLTISEQAFAQLLDAAEADMILSQALSALPEDIAGRGAALLHGMAQAVLQEMNALRISDHPTRSRLLIKSLGCDSFDTARALLMGYTP